MSRKTITQEYFVLAVNEKGSMPPMRREEASAGIVAAGIMDLLLHGVITMEKKRITVSRALPEELTSLSSLYGYLQEKQRTADKVMSDYVASTGKRLRELMTETGEALSAAGAARRAEGGFLGSRTVYIPEQACREEVTGHLKSAVAGDGEMTPHDMALLCILKETKNLNQYFSEAEKGVLKAKVKELKNHPQNRQLADMINYVSDMTAVMAAAVVAGVL